MQDYIIITDSTCDLPEELLKNLDVKIIPMEVSIEEEKFKNIKDFYEKLRNKKAATTTQINSTTFCEIFEEELKKGKDIIYICFSSGLSGTYNSSLIAIDELNKKYPKSKIISVDSLCASLGEGFLVYHAIMKKNEGYSIEELKTWIEKNRNRVCHWFTVDDLFHLKRGGRVSSTAAVFGTMLNIKPVLHVDDEGHLIPKKKIRGRKQALDSIIEEFENTQIDEENQIIFISHGDAEKDAKYVADIIKKRHKSKKIIMGYIGPIVGAHSGPGTVSLFFWGKHK